MSIVGHAEKEARRVFATGASRNSDEGKLDFEGFLSPLVLLHYAKYLDKHRCLEDGSLRDSDNWQKGIPRSQIMKSFWRHFVDVWLHHRGLGSYAVESLNDALCGVIFNAMAYLHEYLLTRNISDE